MMSNIGLVDIGGTSIKFAAMVDDKLEKFDSIVTPKNLENFYTLLTD